nr:MAG: hypothetical protein [Bacteriophage sp.]
MITRTIITAKVKAEVVEKKQIRESNQEK